MSWGQAIELSGNVATVVKVDSNYPDLCSINCKFFDKDEDICILFNIKLKDTRSEEEYNGYYGIHRCDECLKVFGV